MPSFYEFFAGGGMARAGLGDGWDCLFANDIDEKKGASYGRNWGSEHLMIQDVGALTTDDVPGRADVTWASFPCQDLSLAGAYVGLKGRRSGTFWAFWQLMETLVREGRAPSVVVLENVCGALTSHGGEDFAAITTALASAGYRFGAVVMDAVHFVPQSRPRLFIIAIDETISPPPGLTSSRAAAVWHPSNLIDAYERLSSRLKAAWLWWNIPVPPPRQTTFSDILEDQPGGVTWHTDAETNRLLSMMSPLNREKVENAKRSKTAYGRRHLQADTCRRRRYSATTGRNPFR
jgi:DNA (cytosine-5)-methyltransferase 1